MSIAFPDNDNRERRAIELMTDCNSSMARLVSMEADISIKITQLSDLAQKMIKALEPDTPLKVTQVQLYDTVWKISDIVSSSLVFGLAYKVLSKAVAARIIVNAAAVEDAGVVLGEIGADAAPNVVLGEIGVKAAPKAAEELGIPLTAKLAGAAGGTILAVGVGFAVDAIEGTIARDKLRDKIHQNIPLRTTQKVNEQQVQVLQAQVSAHLAALEIVMQLGTYTKETVEATTPAIIEKFKPLLEQINATTANQELATLDAARDSWTNEDN